MNLLRSYGLHVDLFYADLNVAYLRQGQIAIRKSISSDTAQNKTTILSGPAMPKNTSLGLNHWVKRYAKLVSAYITAHGKPDIIHAHTYLGGSIASIIKQTHNIPYIITEHYTGWMTGEYRQSHYNLASEAYRKANLITSVSQALQSSLSDLFQIKSKVISNFINFDIFKPGLSTNKSNFNIVGVGDLIPRKQWELLIDSFGQFQKKIPQSTLTIIGDGSEKTKLKQLINQLSLNGQINLAGSLSKSEVAQIIAQANLLVHPSKIESFGLTPIEALASGVPVICNANGGSKEYEDLPGVTVLEKMNSKSLTNSILKVYDQNQAGDLNKKEIRNACRQRFDIKQVGIELTKLYQEVIRSN